MTFQSLIWRFRWTFDKKWGGAAKARYQRERARAVIDVKPLRETPLRKFLATRVGPSVAKELADELNRRKEVTPT